MLRKSSRYAMRNVVESEKNAFICVVGDPRFERNENSMIIGKQLQFLFSSGQVKHPRTSLDMHLGASRIVVRFGVVSFSRGPACMCACTGRLGEFGRFSIGLLSRITYR